MWIWELFRVFFTGIRAGLQLMRGVFYLARLRRPIVSVFGGKRASSKNVDLDKVQELSALLVEHGYAVITGGGPGVMQHANCGAFKKAKELGIKKRVTLGICITGVDEKFINPCAKEVAFNYFFVRKWLLTRYSRAIVIFPGGIGTVDELFDVLNLLKLSKIPKVPIILFGKEYWKDVLSWYDHAIEKGFIPQDCKKLIIVTDNIADVLKIIKQ